MTKKIKNASVSGSATPVYTEDTKALIKKAGEAAAAEYVASPEGQKVLKETVDKIKEVLIPQADQDASQSTRPGKRKLTLKELQDPNTTWSNDKGDTFKLGTVVAVDGPKDDAPLIIHMDSRVIINKRAVEPFITDVKFINGELVFEGQTISVGWCYPRARFDTTVNGYKFMMHGRPVVVFLCSDSFLEITDSQPIPWMDENKRFGSDRHAAILINSTSLNDTFIGTSYLQNVESSNNLINGTILRAEKNKPGRARVWDPDDYEQYSFETSKFDKNSKRHRYDQCQFKNAVINDSVLPPGLYRKSIITSSTITGARRVEVDDCELSDVSIASHDLRLRHSHLKRLSINCEGSAELHNQKLDRDNFHCSGLYLANKFCFTKIPLVSRNDLLMVRCSKTEFELTGGIGRGDTPVKFPLNSVNSYQTRQQIADVLNEDARYSRLSTIPENEIGRSLCDFVVDSIFSRAKIINLLDAATGVADVLGFDKPGYDNLYDV